MTDHRNKERRLLDAIVEAPQVNIDAYNEGFVWSTSAAPKGSAPYSYVQEENSPGQAFWDGVQDAQKHMDARFDALFGPEDESPLRKGLRESAAGDVHDLGSFAQYVGDER